MSTLVRSTRLRGFEWRLRRRMEDDWRNPGGKREVWSLNLISARGRVAATVFLTRDLTGHNWYVWDEQGVGGENSCEDDVADAIREAELATKRWGKHLPVRRARAEGR